MLFKFRRLAVDMVWEGHGKRKAVSAQMWVYLCNQMKKVEAFFKLIFIYSFPLFFALVLALAPALFS